MIYNFESLQDEILGKISKHGIDIITYTELQFLDIYHDETQEERKKELYNEITLAKIYYYELFNYDPRDENEDFKKLDLDFSKWTDDEILDSKYSLIWLHLDVEYMEAFAKVYKVQNKYYDQDWVNLPDKVKNSFKIYLNETFNI